MASIVSEKVVEFDGDLNKAYENKNKHGVSFDEAKTVFDDSLACIFDDEWSSIDEQRELIIGYSVNHRLLIISFVERQDIIRIISAREATPRERKDYESHKCR
uniref:Uncharacterized protein n=1 Tax=Candidatus Kentrum sp. DK TaxID=2126562 RepID=A0A450RZZ8_9GAMM|nr:MAG: hypothetical protein BECKDK2373C_GA0170839_100919 [Candidatus Kentron sp. DK]VFJ44864.1 MAG: hypothetical protein BECKDK2373B_GA0170837_100829 [Candidatus Kentron sp. DK]